MMEMEAAARAVVARLQAAGFTAYFAGGCVRDALRGVTPKDYDIATSARPEQVQALFPRTRGGRRAFRGDRVLEGGFQFEVASFRADGAYLDGRRPVDVTFTTPQGDAERRDFTVNGMFYDPVAGRGDRLSSAGRPTCSAACCAPSATRRRASREDRLRLLRAVRFAAGAGVRGRTGRPGPRCARRRARSARSAPSASRTNWSKSSCRRRACAASICSTPAACCAPVLPELDACKGCEQPPQFHPEGDVFVHTRLMLSLLPEAVSVPLVFSVLLHDIGKPPDAHGGPDEAASVSTATSTSARTWRCA